MQLPGTSPSTPIGSSAPPGQAAVALTVVIPAYNEERRLGRGIDAVRAYVQGTGRPCELIVVDDGSTDGTAELVQRFMKPLAASEEAGSAAPAQAGCLTIRLLRNGVNRGKGFSVRRGMLEATGDTVLMSDADLSTPIEEVNKLLPWLAQGFDVVIASRDLPDSVLDPPQPWHRRTLAKVFRALRQRLMLSDIRDTQCGFKLFRRAAAQRVFSQETEPGWAFDCEVLGLARLMGCRIKEVGVLWRNDPDSRVRTIPDGWRMLVSLYRIARKLRRLAVDERG